MAQQNKVYVGDYGTKLIFDIGVDTSEVSVANIVYKKPNGEKGKWGASLQPNSNEIYYIVNTTDLDVAGLYKLQPEVTLNSGWHGRGEMVELFVSEII